MDGLRPSTGLLNRVLCGAMHCVGTPYPEFLILRHGQDTKPQVSEEFLAVFRHPGGQPRGCEIQTCVITGHPVLCRVSDLHVAAPGRLFGYFWVITEPTTSLDGKNI